MPDVQRTMLATAWSADEPRRGELRRFAADETVRWTRIVQQAGLAGSQ